VLKQKTILAFLLLSFFILPEMMDGANWGTLQGRLGGIAVEIFSIPTAEAQTVGDTASKFIGGILEITTVLNWVALTFVQELLNPNVIFGWPGAGGVRPLEIVLNQIWRLSRDIVNAGFAFMLIAAGVLLILKGDTTIIKEKWQKFVLSVILVNFSWFFPRIMLDMANVMQAVVYQIPFLIQVEGAVPACINGFDPGPDAKPGTADDTPRPCDFVWKVCLFPLSNIQCKLNPGDPRPDMKPGTLFPHKGRQIGNLLDIYFADWSGVRAAGGITVAGTTRPISGAAVVVNGLAVNFAQLPNLARVEFGRAAGIAGAVPGAAAKAEAYLKFFIYLAFHAIVSVGIGMILISMAAVLFIRIAVIWLCIAFMPFIFVGYAWKGSLGDMGSEGFPNIWQEFIRWCFLPVFIAVPLAIGFTLLRQLPLISGFAAMDTMIEFGGIREIFTGINSLHELLWMLLTLGILWIGTFKVIEKSSSFAGGIVTTIKGVGESSLKTLGMGAAHAIPFPVPGTKGTTVADAIKGISGFAKGKAVDFRGKDASPTFTPLPPQERIDTAQKQLRDHVTIDNLRELRGILGGGGTTAQRQEQVANFLARNASLSPDEARAIAQNPREAQEMIESAIVNNGKINDENLRRDILSDLQRLNETSTHGTLGLNFNLPGMGQNEVKQEFNEFKSFVQSNSNVTNDQIVSALQSAVASGNTFAKDIAQAALNQINANTDAKQAVRNMPV